MRGLAIRSGCVYDGPPYDVVRGPSQVGHLFMRCSLGIAWEDVVWADSLGQVFVETRRVVACSRYADCRCRLV